MKMPILFLSPIHPSSPSHPTGNHCYTNFLVTNYIIVHNWLLPVLVRGLYIHACPIINKLDMWHVVPFPAGCAFSLFHSGVVMWLVWLQNVGRVLFCWHWWGGFNSQFMVCYVAFPLPLNLQNSLRGLVHQPGSHSEGTMSQSCIPSIMDMQREQQQKIVVIQASENCKSFVTVAKPCLYWQLYLSILRNI